MNLTWRIVIRISLLMVLLLGVWAFWFYRAIINEVNDETDDSLELLSENLINRVLEGEDLPNVNNGTNNTFYLDSLSAEQVGGIEWIRYSNEDIFIIQKDETEPSRVLRTVFRDNKNNYYQLTVAIPTVESEDLHEAIINWIVILYVALLLLIIVVCFWVLWRTMKPLYVLLKWVDNYDISQSNSATLNNETKIKEFKKLNEAVERFVKKSENMFLQQKQFIGNASHEIQTPLAICKNRLDLLAQTNLNEEQYAEVTKIQCTLSYLSRLNKELLLLAKIDAGQFSEVDKINISSLVTMALDDCNVVYAQKNITINNNLDKDNFILNINPTLAAIIVNNLIKNAFVHNYEYGKIEVNIINGELQVLNTANSEELDSKQIFERFYQGNKREGSTGLGLALVRAIAEKCNYKMGYEYFNNMHKFFIKF